MHIAFASSIPLGCVRFVHTQAPSNACRDPRDGQISTHVQRPPRARVHFALPGRTAFVAGSSAIDLLFSTLSSPGAAVEWRRRRDPSSAPYTPCLFPTSPRMMASEVTIAKKAAKVASVKNSLESSMLLVCTPLDGLTVSQVGALKNRMPEGTTAGTVKNTLMRRAIDGSEWAAAESMTKQSSLWLFIKEDMKGSLQVYQQYMKEIAREAPIRGGVFEGEAYDAEGVDKLSKLPTKKELITKIAISIKSVPTKIGRSVKQVPEKVGRAVKLAFAEEQGEGDEQSSE